MEKIDGMSMDLEQANMAKLRSVFPECFAEGKLDMDKLLALCGKYTENDLEKYRFEWHGKSECLRLAQKRSTGTLRPCPEESVDWEHTKNLYIEGDNLEVLKLLQTAYYRKVKMIYIDPPYNTGNDFVYADDFADPISRYKEITQQTTKSNPETMGRYHTNWLNMMYPRLRLAANLLRDDGVIFISIDDNEQSNLRKLCDETFGEENLVTQIIWQKKYTRANDAKWFSDNHDFILCYAKNKEQLLINLLPRNDDQLSAYSNPDNHPKGVWKATPLHAKSGTNTKPYTFSNGVVWQPPAGTFRRFNDESMQEMEKNNEIWFGSDGKQIPSRKSFLCDVKSGVTPVTIWPYDEVGHNHEANNELKALELNGIFNNPKPTRLIKRILQLTTSSDDIILDFFSGSATTAHAVMRLNAEDGGSRQFIMVQLPEVCDEKSEAYKAGYKNICEIGKERIRRAGAKIMHNAQCTIHNEKDAQLTLDNHCELSIMNYELDTGFRVFKLDSSNLKTWDGTPVSEEDYQLVLDRMNDMIDSVKNDRSNMDVVYEIMLKMGVPLTYSVMPLDFDGVKAYSIGEDGLLIVCLDEGITTEAVEQMADCTPAKIILAESCFADISAMRNAHYVLQNRGIELKLI